MIIDMISTVPTFVLAEKKQSLLSGYFPIYTEKTYTSAYVIQVQHSRLIGQGITLLCKHNGVKNRK